MSGRCQIKAAAEFPALQFLLPPCTHVANKQGFSDMKCATLSVLAVVVLAGLSGCITQRGPRPTACMGGSCTRPPRTASVATIRVTPMIPDIAACLAIIVARCAITNVRWRVVTGETGTRDLPERSPIRTTRPAGRAISSPRIRPASGRETASVPQSHPSRQRELAVCVGAHRAHHSSILSPAARVNQARSFTRSFASCGGLNVRTDPSPIVALKRPSKK